MMQGGFSFQNALRYLLSLILLFFNDLLERSLKKEPTTGQRDLFINIQDLKLSVLGQHLRRALPVFFQQEVGQRHQFLIRQKQESAREKFLPELFQGISVLIDTPS